MLKQQRLSWALILVASAAVIASCQSTTSPSAAVGPTPDNISVTSSPINESAATISPELPARSTRYPAERYADLEIITLLPPDAIPAIDNPQFLTAVEANEFYVADELVIGVAFGDEARAYSVPFLSGHEIVNDTIGGVKIAVTW